MGRTAIVGMFLLFGVSLAFAAGEDWRGSPVPTPDRPYQDNMGRWHTNPPRKPYRGYRSYPAETDLGESLLENMECVWVESADDNAPSLTKVTTIPIKTECNSKPKDINVCLGTIRCDVAWGKSRLPGSGVEKQGNGWNTSTTYKSVTVFMENVACQSYGTMCPPAKDCARDGGSADELAAGVSQPSAGKKQNRANKTGMSAE